MIAPQARSPGIAAGLLLAGLAACAAENGDGGRAASDEGARVGEEARDGNDPGADYEAAADRPICLQGEPFIASGTIPVADADAAGSDAGISEADRSPDQPAREVSALRWERHDGCERFVIDLDSDDEQAPTPGSVHADLLRDVGVVRLQLRDAQSVATDATDARFDGPLAGAAYAVRSPEGRWIYVDLHLDRAAEAHVLRLSDPARIVVDLRPGGPALPPPPARGQRVVILEPRAGPATYPLTVTGYARTFEANVVARVVQDSRVVRDTFTTSTAWADAWGHFSMTIPNGPSGVVELQAGEHSARDGTWEGVSVELDIQ